MSARKARLAAFARLRQQLDARSLAPARPPDEAVLPTRMPGIDEPLGGGLPRGALTELVFSAPSSGGQLLLLHLLHAARRAHRFLALIDGSDGFDPQTIEPTTLLRQLLWVRCSGAPQAMQTADLIARDSNFAMLALDLRGCSMRELRRTRSTAWYRLQRIVEPTDTVLAVLTPRRLVPAAAQARLVFERSLPLTALAMEQTDIAEQLAPSIDRARGGTTWAPDRSHSPSSQEAPAPEATNFPGGSRSPLAPTADTPDYVALNGGTGGPPLSVASATG